MRANGVFRSVQCSKMSHRVACCSYTMESLLLMTRPGVSSRSKVSVVPEGFLSSSGECWKQAMTEIFRCIIIYLFFISFSMTTFHQDRNSRHTHTTDDNDIRPHTVQEHNERISTELT